MDFSRDELKEFEGKLLKNGYRCHAGGYKNETYGWWKSFDEYDDGTVGYQIALLVYDFSDLFSDLRPDHTLGVQCEFLIGGRHNIGRVDMSISNDVMTIERFEQLCQRFYEFVLNNFEVNFKNK